MFCRAHISSHWSSPDEIMAMLDGLLMRSDLLAWADSDVVERADEKPRSCSRQRWTSRQAERTPLMLMRG